MDRLSPLALFATFLFSVSALGNGSTIKELMIPRDVNGFGLNYGVDVMTCIIVRFWFFGAYGPVL